MKAVIFGCAGTSLSDEERNFFHTHQPYGFILFARNCSSPEQVKTLVAQLHEAVGREHIPILIDQEGGRVARLRPPHWRAYPSAATLAALAEDSDQKAARAVCINARLIAYDLRVLGINVNCAPLADIPVAGSHAIIGDRAFGTTPAQVASLARAQAEGLMGGGVVPVLKHIPGHGRARVDSHEDLPVVDTSLETLRASDFVPFTQLHDLAMGMTAHIIYQAIDTQLPATLSPAAIALIREEIGFDGMLMSDDVSMKALQGEMGALSAQILEAGCDIVLHCNGRMDEMVAIADAVGELSTHAHKRHKKVENIIANTPEQIDINTLLAEMEALAPGVYGRG